MGEQIQKLKSPDYKKIYTDILNKKHPEKKDECKELLLKKQLTSMDVILINQIIFGKENILTNQIHRSYDVKTIFEILEFQKENHLNNSQVALHFKLSRNTIAKWRKSFLIKKTTVRQ